jgi:hypothetical protein
MKNDSILRSTIYIDADHLVYMKDRCENARVFTNGEKIGHQDYPRIFLDLRA